MEYLKCGTPLFEVAELRIELRTSGLWIRRSNQLSYPAISLLRVQNYNIFFIPPNKLPEKSALMGKEAIKNHLLYVDIIFIGAFLSKIIRVNTVAFTLKIMHDFIY